MSEFCAQCGNSVESADRFCRQCGTEISRATDSTHDDTAAQPAKGRRLPALVMIGLGLFVTAAMVLGIMLWRNSRAGSPEGAPAAALDPAELSGTWEGTYRYADRSQPPVNFTFAASFDRYHITGTMMEPHTIGSSTPPSQTATVEGQLDGTSVQFSKRYGSGPPVNYDGMLDPATKTVEGTWRRENLHGSFQMVRRTPDQQVVAAVAPQPDPVAIQAASNAQLAAAIRSHMLNMRRIVYDTDNSDCARATRGTLVCGSITMRTAPCSEILDIERVQVTDIGRDAAFGLVPVEAVVWIRVTDLARFQGQQRALVDKCVSAPGANWSTETATPVRMRFDAERWQSGWRIAGR